MKRVLIRLLKVVVALALVVVLTGAVLSFIGGRQYEAELQKLKATGEPYTLVDLAGPAVPDDENGAVVYERMFRRLLGHSSLDIRAKPDKECERAARERSKVYEKIMFPSNVHDGFGAPAAGAQPSPADWVEARRVATKYDWVLPMIDEAAAKPHCKFPVRWEDGCAALFAHAAQLRELQRIVMMKAIVYAHYGQTDDAVRCVRLGIDASRALQTEASLISFLVHLAQIRITSASLANVVNETRLSPAQAKAIYDRIGSIDLRPHLILSAKGERGYGLQLMAQARRQGITRVMSLFTPDGGGRPSGAWALDAGWRTLSYLDAAAYLRFMQKQIDTAGVPYRDLKPKNDADAMKGVPIYCVLTRVIVPVFGRVRASADREMADCALGQAAVTLAAYRSRFGAYPDTLAQASDKMGWKIPDDPFSGKSLVYRRRGAGYVLYSIGANLKDDGGTPPGDNQSLITDGDTVWIINQ
jgi:type II secretory pathway pseudopilin PulG